MPAITNTDPIAAERARIAEINPVVARSRDPQGSPHSGLTLDDIKESGGWLPGGGKNQTEPMMVLF